MVPVHLPAYCCFSSNQNLAETFQTQSSHGQSFGIVGNSLCVNERKVFDNDLSLQGFQLVAIVYQFGACIGIHLGGKGGINDLVHKWSSISVWTP